MTITVARPMLEELTAWYEKSIEEIVFGPPLIEKASLVDPGLTFGTSSMV
jgi:hypothetical protein